MKVSDWVAVAQAVALAVAAIFAWSTYRNAQVDRRRAPRRRLLLDAIEELKALAYEAEVDVPGVGTKRLDIIRAHQKRLAISLAPVRWVMLTDTVRLAYVDAAEIDKNTIVDAVADLNWAISWLEVDPRGFGEVDLEFEGEDRAPLPIRSRTLRQRWRVTVLGRLRLARRALADQLQKLWNRG